MAYHGTYHKFAIHKVERNGLDDKRALEGFTILFRTCIETPAGCILLDDDSCAIWVSEAAVFTDGYELTIKACLQVVASLNCKAVKTCSV